MERAKILCTKYLKAVFAICLSVSASVGLNSRDVLAYEKSDTNTESSFNIDQLVSSGTDDSELSATQMNTINMLNYMRALTQQINQQKNNQLFLESAYESFDNLYPNSVDTNTQAEVTDLMGTIQNYRMIAVKRDRLQFLYEQSQAQALRSAIPSPMAILNVVQSGNPLKAAVSVLYLAVDSKNSYDAAKSQADLQFIKDGWELDDQEAEQLHNSTVNALNYMYNMVRQYDLPGDYALSKESIEDFITWRSKPDSQRSRKITWLEGHKGTYEKFGPYWLALAECYYADENYQKCWDAIKQYETISTRIFRKNLDYASALPMAIISAKEILTEDEYVKEAKSYCGTILANSKDEDWTIRYFVAQTYLDLYSITEETDYLKRAYRVVYDNVNELVDSQKKMNSSYLAPVTEVKINKKTQSKREQEEAKQYNKIIKEERKVALPPVNEALYLNCDLLFALADKLKVNSEERSSIEEMLHENGSNLFLTEALDNRFWFEKKDTIPSGDEVEIAFDGEELTLPVTCISERSLIQVTISNSEGNTNIEDWTVSEVKRPKKSSVSDFKVIFKSKTGEDYKYKPGDVVTVKVTPVVESPDSFLEFNYDVVETKTLKVIRGIKFMRKS